MLNIRIEKLFVLGLGMLGLLAFSQLQAVPEDGAQASTGITYKGRPMMPGVYEIASFGSGQKLQRVPGPARNVVPVVLQAPVRQVSDLFKNLRLLAAEAVGADRLRCTKTLDPQQ